MDTPVITRYNGVTLRFIVTEDTTIQQGVSSGNVPVEAEAVGAVYNVSEGQITVSLVHIEGIDSVTNASDWMTEVGSDIEDIETYRSRILGSWAVLATNTTAAKYKSVCENVDGVLYVQVDDQAPRGQGTIDIVVTSTAGAATETLLASVAAAAETVAGAYDDISVISATVVTQDIAVSITVSTGTNTDGMEDSIISTITTALKISTNRNLYELIHADLIYAIKRDVPLARNVKITTPDSDLVLDTDKVIIAGTITVTIAEG